MTAWSHDELNKIGGAEEVRIAALGRDGTPRKAVTVWLVRHDDDLYVRSAVKGRDAAWYHGVQRTHQGRIWAGGLEKDVTFVDADHEIDDAIDAAYRSKYRRYTGRILDSCLTADARSTTTKLVPR
ncbi:MAG TPA: DUF2255 family protein [Candidatus Dormibacteraeota bacterium]